MPLFSSKPASSYKPIYFPFRDKSFFFLFIWVMLVSIALSHANASQTGQQPAEKKLSERQMAMKQLISQQIKERYISTRTPWHPKTLERFYEMHDYHPVWISMDGKWLRDVMPYVEMVERADQHALDPSDYPLREIFNAKVDGSGAKQILAKDIAVTNELIQYIHDVKSGRVNPAKVFPGLFLLRDPYDAVQVLTRALAKDEDDAVDYLVSLEPEHKAYKKLKEGLAYYRGIAAKGDWPKLEYHGLIKPGATHRQIPHIRSRIAELDQLHRGDRKITAVAIDPQDKNTRYDAALEEKIRTLQEIYHVKVDGVIGRDTLDILNMSLGDRIRKIEMAMERWRWLPQNLGEKYVFVNIAGFYADAVSNGKVVLHTPVIVGKVAHATPAFSSHIENVKFYPDWSVPVSIAHRYVLDKIQNNPAVIDSLGYELLRGNELVPWSQVNIASLTRDDFPPYRFRQKPGYKNALGLVRFTFDNPYSIFMHDTPKDGLFDENQRTFSSGCIRLEKPVEMAQFVLSGNSSLSSSEVARKFDTAKDMEHPKTEIIPVNQPIPLHLTYMTAWVDQEGYISFAPDVYGRDKKLKQALYRDK